MANSVEPFLRQSVAIVFFGYLQPKQLQPDYVSSHNVVNIMLQSRKGFSLLLVPCSLDLAPYLSPFMGIELSNVTLGCPVNGILSTRTSVS